MSAAAPSPSPAVPDCHFRGDANGASVGDIQEDGSETGLGYKEWVRSTTCSSALGMLGGAGQCKCGVRLDQVLFRK